jgi:hypothetical protein
MSEIEDSELGQKFTSEIEDFKRLPTLLGRVEVVLLMLFGLHDRTAYDIFLHFKNEVNPMPYGNIHKRVKRLEELGLIKASKQGVRNTIKYKLTSRGLFEMLLLPGLSYEVSIWKEHSKNIILQTLLYQFFEVSTIEVFSNSEFAYGRMAFSQYLKSCCEGLLNSLELKRRRYDRNGNPLDPDTFLLKIVEIQVRQLVHDIVSFSSQLNPQIFPTEVMKNDTKFITVLKKAKNDFEQGCRNFNL